MKRALYAIPVLVCLAASCQKDEEDPITPDPPDPNPVSPVVFDANNLADSLSEFFFFQGDISAQQPTYGVLPYDVLTPLFSDYAHKKRFIWMPTGTSAVYVNDSTVLDFPDGTVIIKTFYYDHVQPQDVTVLVETRLLYKHAGSWHFADYIWNAEQTEAVQDLTGSYKDLSWVNDDGTPKSTEYRIPSEAECQTCHKRNNNPIPIGPKPQNLNKVYNYSDGPMNQLAKWQEMGYLQSYPSNIATTVAWDDPTQSLTDRVRAYVDMNCSHCHANDRHCDYRPMRFAWNETVVLSNLGVNVAPDEPLLPQHTHIVKPGNLERSLLYYRINSVDETVRMPLLGRTLIHDEGRALIEEWIMSL